MKIIILLGLLLPMFARSQEIAVLDPGLRKPASYVAKISMDHLLRGAFVIHRGNIPAVMETVRSFRVLIDDKKNIPADRKSVVTGTTYFTASRNKGNYHIVLDTKIDKMGSYFVLADPRSSRKDNLESIDRFLAYLDKSK